MVYVETPPPIEPVPVVTEYIAPGAFEGTQVEDLPQDPSQLVVETTVPQPEISTSTSEPGEEPAVDSGTPAGVPDTEPVVDSGTPAGSPDTEPVINEINGPADATVVAAGEEEFPKEVPMVPAPPPTKGTLVPVSNGGMKSPAPPVSEVTTTTHVEAQVSEDPPIMITPKELAEVDPKSVETTVPSDVAEDTEDETTTSSVLKYDQPDTVITTEESGTGGKGGFPIEIPVTAVAFGALAHTARRLKHRGNSPTDSGNQ